MDGARTETCIDISPDLSVGTDCWESSPCQHSVQVGGVQHLWCIGDIAALILKRGIKIALTTEYNACLVTALFKQAPKQNLPSFLEIGPPTQHKCPAGHPMYAVGRALDNGWSCNGSSDCALAELWQSAGVERFRCFACDHDLCHGCLAK